MSLLLLFKRIVSVTKYDLGYKPKGWINLLISRGSVGVNSAYIVNGGTIMDDLVMLMDGAGLMGGATNQYTPPTVVIDVPNPKSYGVLDRTPQGVLLSTKPKGGFQ